MAARSTGSALALEIFDRKGATLWTDADDSVTQRRGPTALGCSPSPASPPPHAPPQSRVGQRVLVEHKNLGTADMVWYEGTVARTHGTKVLVAFDDGERRLVDPAKEQCVWRTCSPPPPSCKEQRVLVEFQNLGTTDMVWYEGVVQETQGRKLKVRFEDGDTSSVDTSKESVVWRGAMRSLSPPSPPPSFACVGHRVLVEHRNMCGPVRAWYEGIVTGTQGPEVFVRFDDGEQRYVDPRKEQVIFRNLRKGTHEDDGPEGGAASLAPPRKRARCCDPTQGEGGPRERVAGVHGGDGMIQGSLRLCASTWRSLARMIPVRRVLHLENFVRPSPTNLWPPYLDSPLVASARSTAALDAAVGGSADDWLHIPKIARLSPRFDRATRDLHRMLFVKGDCLLLREAPPIDVVCVPDDDGRRDLRGRSMAIATRNLAPYEIVGFYTGQMLTTEEYNQNRASFVEQLQHDRYAFDFEWGRKRLVIDPWPSGCGMEERFGNETMAINDYRISPATGDRGVERKNCEFLQILTLGFPAIVVQTCKAVLEHDELLLDYGKLYWKRSGVESALNSAIEHSSSNPRLQHARQQMEKILSVIAVDDSIPLV